MMDRRKVLGLTATLAAAGLGLYRWTGRANADDEPPPTRRYLVGLYSNGSSIESYSAFLGYPPEFTLDGTFQDHHAGGGFSSGDADGYPVVIYIDVYRLSGSAMSYREVASGYHDEALVRTLRSAQRTYAEHQVYALRLDPEANLNDDFFACDPVTYCNAINRVIAVCRRHFPRARMIWNPNWGRTGKENAIRRYVPADADIIGIDAYNNPAYQRSSEEGARAILYGDGGLDYWADIGRTRRMALALPEWGDDFGEGHFIHAVRRWADKPANNVVLLGYWDSSDGENAKLRGASLEAFGAAFRHRPYQGDYWQLKPTTRHRRF